MTGGTTPSGPGGSAPAPAWHLDRDLADRYAGGALTTALASSVELHLTACPACRGLLAPHVPAARLDAVWAEVIERVEQPPRSLVERVLARAGVDEATARLVAATPSLRGAWVGGVAVVLALALLAAYVVPHGVAIYLALAPLLPVAGVALAFGRASDPAFEVVASTPFPALRLLALRTAFVVATTLVPAALAGLALPAPWLAAAWLLPALALTVGTLALGTRVPPVTAAGGLSALWLAVSLRALAPGRDPLLAAGAPVLLGALAALAAALAVLALRGCDLAELVRRTA
ncbi:MAG TPA: hypothetical protein VFS29_08565 [Motilibacteraceae bacterium]|nr:hypothetical protein [Motilibacteraceae bacterium]